MRFFKELKEKYTDYMLDHPILKNVMEYVFSILATAIAAFLLAYNYRSFVSTPSYLMVHNADGTITMQAYNLIAGGVSGIGQVINLIISKFGIDVMLTPDQIQSVVYFVCNIPLFILAYCCIGKRFALLSVLNVALSSLFISIIPEEWTNIFQINDLLARAVCAGVINGLAISIAVECNHSTGGTDIISLYVGLKKGKDIGKYVFGVNFSIVLIYTILSSIATPNSPAVPGAATMALFTLVFFFTSSVMIDKLSTRNKKVQLQIVTKEPRLAKVLIQNFPHGCTVVDAKGAFLDEDKKMIFTVLSSFELKKAQRIIYKVDPNAFITVNNAYKVYGKFFLRPMK